MGKKGPLWWRESDWLLRGSSAANQILLHHSGPILSFVCESKINHYHYYCHSQIVTFSVVHNVVHSVIRYTKLLHYDIMTLKTKGLSHHISKAKGTALLKCKV